MKIENELFAEEAIRVHASTIDGCGDLFYTVSLRVFDQIWQRTRASVDRSGLLPKLFLDFGRHEVWVCVDPDAPDETFHMVGSGQPAPLPRFPEAPLSSAAIADGAELASLRAMREALVKLRERAAHVDIAAAQEIDEVLAVAALVMAPVQAMSAGPPIESSADPARAREAPQAAPSPSMSFFARRTYTIVALLTAIDGHIADTRDVGAIEALARAVALLAGAPL